MSVVRPVGVGRGSKSTALPLALPHSDCASVQGRKHNSWLCQRGAYSCTKRKPKWANRGGPSSAWKG
eukprot:13758945-Alexandrium_andersonii.AAC.1